MAEQFSLEGGSARADLSRASSSPEQHSAGPEITITRAEARRLVNYAFMASNASWTPYIRENGVGYQESPWCEFLRIADRIWTVLFPEHPIRQIDPRLPADRGQGDRLADERSVHAEPSSSDTLSLVERLKRLAKKHDRNAAVLGAPLAEGVMPRGGIRASSGAADKERMIAADLVEAASRIEQVEAENARLREGRDEAIRDRNGHAEHILRVVRECEDGLAALTELDEAWEAFGVPSNRKTLTLPEQIAAQNAQIETAESQASRYRKALEWIAPFADMRSKDESKVFARVCRGALRNIAERARQALSLTAGGEEDSASREPSHTHNAAMRPSACTGQGSEP